MDDNKDKDIFQKPEDPSSKDELKEDLVSSIFGSDYQPEESSSIFGLPMANKEMKIAEHEPKILMAEDFQVDCATNLSLPYGIDIGTDTIKIVQLVVDKKTLKVGKWAIGDAPADTIKKTKDKDAFLEFIKKTLIENKIKGKAYVSISSSDVLMYYFSLPQMPHSELGKAIEWEIKQRHREDLPESILEYIILNENSIAEERRVEVVAVLATKSEILKYIDVFKSVGVQPLSIELDIFCLLANLNFYKLIDRNEVVIFLDFGSKVSMFNVIVNNCIRFTRSINLSKQRIVKATGNYFDISYEEADKMLNSFIEILLQKEKKPKNAVLDEAKQNELFREVYIPFFQKTVLDVDRMFKHYSFQITKSRVPKFDRIIIHGGLVGLPMLYDYLSEQFDVPIYVINPCAGIQLKGKNQELEEQWDEVAFRFPVAIGAALRYFDDQKSEM